MVSLIVATRTPKDVYGTLRSWRVPGREIRRPNRRVR